MTNQLQKGQMERFKKAVEVNISISREGWEIFFFWGGRGGFQTSMSGIKKLFLTDYGPF
jgi:hypothetical protein